MIFEYALDPELACTWTDRDTCRYFKDQFGIDRGRLVSRYPKRWKKKVWNAFQKSRELLPKTEEVEAQTQKEEGRLTELLQRLSEIMIKRYNYTWNENDSWLNNALSEYHQDSFRAIITRNNPNESPFIVTPHDLYDHNCQYWEINRGLTVKRKAKDMANAVSPMLKCCRVVIFIDPYFRAKWPKWQKVFEAFFKQFPVDNLQSRLLRIEIHASADIKYAPSSDYFHDECNKYMISCIPKGLNVLFKRWKQKPNGEKLHNRYILTDIGGVTFSIGLDEGDEGETDDVTLMDRKQYELRWSQYASANPAFDLAESPFQITGKLLNH
jgi:hypothetical protein